MKEILGVFRRTISTFISFISSRYDCFINDEIMNVLNNKDLLNLSYSFSVKFIFIT